MSFTEWLVLFLAFVQALATVVAVFVAWRAVVAASETRREEAVEPPA